MSKPSPEPRRPGAVDTLVKRDQTAVFWFLVAVATCTACAWYISAVGKELQARPPFVVMDASDAYYIPPGFPFHKMDRMHRHMAYLATETILERNQDGFVYPERLEKLCLSRDIFRGIQRSAEKESRDFRNQKTVQTVEVDSYRLIDATELKAGTETKGRVRRVGYFEGKEKVELFTFTLKIIWRSNTAIVANKKFPSLIEKVFEFKLEPVTTDS